MPGVLTNRIHPRVALRWWQLLAVAAVIVAYVVLLRPASGSDATADAQELMPSDVMLYVAIDLDTDAEQYTKMAAILKRFPSFDAVRGVALGRITGPSDETFAFDKDIRPWAGDSATVAVVPGKASRPQSLLAIDVDDEGKAKEFLDGLKAKPTVSKHRGTEIRAYAPDFVTAFAGDFLVVGEADTVKRTIDLADGRGGSLADNAQAQRALDGVAAERVALAYASRDGVRDVLLEGSGALAQLGGVIDHPALQATAAAITARDGKLVVSQHSALDAKANKDRPAYGAFPSFEPTLDSEVSGTSFLYLGAADFDRTLDRLLGQAGVSIPGFGDLFERFRKGLGKEARVDLEKQLFPLLKGEAAISVAPGQPAPVVTAVIDDVDEKKARSVLASLQGPIIKAIQPGEGQRAAQFAESDVGGVRVNSLQLTPTINLSYALFEGQLVITTDPQGVERIRKNREPLADSDGYKSAFAGAPDEAATVVFVDLATFVDLAVGAGLGQDPGFGLIRDDVERLQALGVTVQGSEADLDVRATLTIR
ncbi:MAG: DUF3352 domain-containing protein [Solirubrobacterales bacterium]